MVKIFLEDAGYDWKILGPDVSDIDYVSWVCDQDAYAFSGQKCSAQSILFMHENWVKAGIEGKLKHYASKRNLNDLTIGPILSWTTTSLLDHIKKLLKIPGQLKFAILHKSHLIIRFKCILGARLAFGGKPLKNHYIPECYGAIEPTAVFVPLEKIIDKNYFELISKEVFGPVQVS